MYKGQIIRDGLVITNRKNTPIDKAFIVWRPGSDGLLFVKLENGYAYTKYVYAEGLNPSEYNRLLESVPSSKDIEYIKAIKNSIYKNKIYLNEDVNLEYELSMEFKFGEFMHK